MCLKIQIKPLLLFLIVFVLFSCTTTQQLTPETIINKSIEYHGGFDKWSELSSLSFDKQIILYTEEGLVESDVVEHQSFTYSNGIEGVLTWEQDGISTIIKLQNSQIIKSINDSVVSSDNDLRSASNKFLAAHYVVNQPFKLKDTTINLLYEGTSLIDDMPHHVIRVGYKGDTDVSDKWFYYFDEVTFQLNATKVIHDSKISLIKNISFDSTSDLLFNHKRESYFLHQDGSLHYLRAKYFYTNYKTK